MRLEISNVSKTYRGGKQAVIEVSMRVGPGVLGLLGPNGAGKSSLMSVLATITRPTAGQVTWNGTDIVRRPDALRRSLGFLPQDWEERFSYPTHMGCDLRKHCRSPTARSVCEPPS